MTNDQSGYKHDASDKKLAAQAEADKEAGKVSSSREHPEHDGDATSKHDDTGKDRMFEGREQHDDADMKSEKNRLAKDQGRHHHPVDGEDAVTESNMHVKRKN